MEREAKKAANGTKRKGEKKMKSESKKKKKSHQEDKRILKISTCDYKSFILGFSFKVNEGTDVKRDSILKYHRDDKVKFQEAKFALEREFITPLVRPTEGGSRSNQVSLV